MASNLETLLEFIPTGTAEGERHLVENVFVEPHNFAQLVVPSPYSPNLLVGKKGAGKSAVLDAVSLFLLENGITALKLSPTDIRLHSESEDGSVASHTRSAYDALVLAVATKLGSQLKGYVSEGELPLLEQAIRAGSASPDFISKLARILPRLAKPLIQVDLDVGSLSKGATAIPALRQAMLDRLANAGGIFYLLIDDTDQVSSPDTASQLNRIWGLLLAARKVTQDSDRLRVVVTLRDEVWRRLQREGAGQRDQADHFDALTRVLSPTPSDVERILLRRLEQAQIKLHLIDQQPWVPFFEGNGARMPSSKEFSSWVDLIISRSRGRPRDALQLLAGLARTCIARNGTRISQDDLDSEMPRFSARRLTYLKNEAEQECPDIEKVVESLAMIGYDQGSFKASFEVIRAALHTLGSQGVTAYGRRIRPGNDEDFLVILRLLFDLEVLNARVTDDRERHGYRHLSPRERVDLVSMARWNELQSIVWEVNPAFRDHLMAVQNARKAQFGLASKKRKRGR